MRNASHASSNDGAVTRIYGQPIEERMRNGSFVSSLFLAWLGEEPLDFEVDLLEKCLIGSLSNGPGTISAQAAKLSASAGNAPNTGMIATLAAIGAVHGGNGRDGVRDLLKIFARLNLKDPYDPGPAIDVVKLARETAAAFKKVKDAAKAGDMAGAKLLAREIVRTRADQPAAHQQSPPDRHERAPL